MDETIVLQNDNLTLKQLSVDNATVLFALTDKNRSHLREWLPWLDFTKEEADTVKFIQGTLETAQKGKGLNLGIWSEDTLVGVVGFNSIDQLHRRAEIGYWIGEENEGKGIMTRACRMLIEYGFEKLNLHRIEIRCATENAKSCNVPIRLGFTHEGTVRDAEWLYDHFVSHHIYGLLRNDWNEKDLQSDTTRLVEKYKGKILGIRNYVSDKKEFIAQDFTDMSLLANFLDEVDTGESDITPAGKSFIEKYYGFSNLASQLISHKQLKEAISEKSIEDLAFWLRDIVPMETMRFVEESRGTILEGQPLREDLLPPKDS